MSWYNPWGIFTGGIDTDAEIQRGQRLDREMDNLNQREVANGTMSRDAYDSFRRNNEFAGEQYREDVADAFWEGAEEGWDRMTAPVEAAVDTGKKVWTAWMIGQWLIVALIVYLAYRYFLGGGSIKQLLK